MVFEIKFNPMNANTSTTNVEIRKTGYISSLLINLHRYIHDKKMLNKNYEIYPMVCGFMWIQTRNISFQYCFPSEL